MILRFTSPRLQSWAVIRARLLRETEEFLEQGLREPQQYRRIPAIRIGYGSFTRHFAETFWSEVLGNVKQRFA